MAQRRSLFEALGIFAYVIAMVLCVFSILNWTSQPYFVASCTAIWILFSLSVVSRLWWGNLSDQTEKVLEIPDAWEEPVGKNPVEERIALEFHAATTESELSTTESARTRTPVIDTKAAGTSKSGLRTARLLQYRQERLSRYRQKRRSSRASASNLSIYRKQARSCTSNGN